MLPSLFVFFGSAVFALIVLYILGIIWFGDKRNKMVRSFFILGVITTYWIVFNGIFAVGSEQSFPALLMIGMVFVCCFPFALLWFTLHYTRSSLIRSKAMFALIITLPAIDIFLMLTNPIHNLYFTDYSFPIPGKGVIFWVHTIVCITVVLLALVRIMMYALKAQKNKLAILCIVVGILISTVMHVLYALDPFISYDLSPIGLFLTFLLFAFSAHRAHIIKFRSTTINQIFSSLDEIFFIFDEDGVLIESNAAAQKMFSVEFSTDGISNVDELLKCITEKTSGYTPNDLLDLMTAKANKCEGEINMVSADKQLKTYALSWRMLIHKNTIRGYILSLSDISRLKNMIREISNKNETLIDLNSKVMEASKAKSAFLANMSHEIRTPLNAIVGMTHIAGESIDNRPKLVSSIGQITRASKHLSELLNNILDMSKIESGKFELASEPFSIKSAFDEVNNIFIQRCNKQNIVLQTDIEPMRSTVVGDALRLKQIIINLLGNAVKFTEPGGTVCLIAKGIESEGALLLSVHVSDTGIGMSQEQMSRLFTAFEQTDSSISAHYGGTGLGLALSQHLAGLMGGMITVESQLGEGSTFSFTIKLPICSENEDDIKEQSRNSFDLSKKRILIVDDIEVNRIIMSEFLSDTSAIIDEAEDGMQAVELFHRSPEQYYDLIFMDVQMPNMDGYEATKQIRATSRKDACTLPIVAMTANAYKEDMEKALDSGMSAHLSKPVDINKVYGIIAEFLSA